MGGAGCFNVFEVEELHKLARLQASTSGGSLAGRLTAGSASMTVALSKGRPMRKPTVALLPYVHFHRTECGAIFDVVSNSYFCVLVSVPHLLPVTSSMLLTTNRD